MKLKGIEYKPAFNSSGGRGFFKEGYAFHRIWQPFGLTYKNSSFIAKTTTLHGRSGNLPLNSRYQPRELIPPCIAVNFRKGIVVNAVGLSGPGANKLFTANHWQKLTEPFFLSFMSVEAKPQDRHDELKEFIGLLGRHLSSFRVRPGLQLNFSCANIGLDPKELFSETATALYTASELDLPLVAKLNATVDVKFGVELSQHPNLDALCMSNAIPWGSLPHKIDWTGLFGSSTSPLIKRGFKQPGALSGDLLRPIVCDWIKAARDAGFTKPIIGCGGIFHPNHVDQIKVSGASAIEVGCASILRPWRVQNIIDRANKIIQPELNRRPTPQVIHCRLNSYLPANGQASCLAQLDGEHWQSLHLPSEPLRYHKLEPRQEFFLTYNPDKNINTSDVQPIPQKYLTKPQEKVIS